MEWGTFNILGFSPDKNGLVFEQCIQLPMEQLMSVMQWKNVDSHVGADFKLSAKQVLEIERLGRMSFCKELDLYLTSYG
ncbi:pyocin S6 family toxin immunity protein [Pseudomonas sp. SMV71]|uniref:pyocin S6 family toxin immunity protein n=1 Tax=Pseudomonas sp. SMV71 TaxID=3390195 RepID=UPI003F824A2D